MPAAQPAPKTGLTSDTERAFVRREEPSGRGASAARPAPPNPAWPGCEQNKCRSPAGLVTAPRSLCLCPSRHALGRRRVGLADEMRDDTPMPGKARRGAAGGRAAGQSATHGPTHPTTPCSRCRGARCGRPGSHAVGQRRLPGDSRLAPNVVDDLGGAASRWKPPATFLGRGAAGRRGRRPAGSAGRRGPSATRRPGVGAPFTRRIRRGCDLAATHSETEPRTLPE